MSEDLEDERTCRWLPHGGGQPVFIALMNSASAASFMLSSHRGLSGSSEVIFGIYSSQEGSVAG
jgi:hypothetical protein